MTISVENCWLVVFPEEMVVLNFFCAHTTAHSSALKLLAFLCLLFLSRVIFPFVWYIASVRLYFEIFVSAYIGLLLLWIYIFDCNNRKEGKGVQICWHDEVNNKWAKILQSRSVYTICSTPSLLHSTNCTTTWNLRLCPDMNWSPKIYKIVRGERMEEKFQTSSSVLHNKVCLHWISTRLNTWNFISNIVKRFVTWC